MLRGWRTPLAGGSDDASARRGSLRRRFSDSRRPELARRYGEALRDGSSRAAETVIDEALAAGVSGGEVQSEIIRPAMRWIGELWEQNALTVADEHLATAISQQALIQLFPSLQAGPPRSRERVLLAAVEGQHHVLGLRMVGDVLEGAGFEVLYLGADVPVESLAQIVRKQRPALIGLSCTFAADSGFLVDAIVAIADSGVETRILLGGDGVAPELRDVGYRWLDDSVGVVEAVEELLGTPPPPLPPAIATLRRVPGAPADTRPAADYDGITQARLLDLVEGANDQARVFARRAQDFHYLALHDALTQLPNRRAFDDRLIEFSRPDAEGVMLMVDLDHFKGVNDRYGHEAGDELLRAVGQAITASLRPGDFAARTGGDEFAVLLPDAQPEPAALLAERIRDNIRRANDYGVTASIGLAPLTANPRAGLLAADEALYAAKEAGRDRSAAAARAGSVPSLVAEHPADRPEHA